MPYKSARQRAYLHIHEPALAKRWDREYGDSMPTSRKNEIKKAITRKPKYGGPSGGRPNSGARVGRAKAASSGINYLVGARGHSAKQNRAFGTLTISPKVKRKLKGY